MNKYLNACYGILVLICSLVIVGTHATNLASKFDKAIYGIIKNENGVGIPGCTILNKRTNVYTTSKEDGRFVIEGFKGDTLEISHVYYVTQRIVITESQHIPEIILKGRETIEDEVVVNTGYQQLPKERSSGSFNVISNKVLNEQVSPNILDRLRNVSNVYFDAKTVDNRKGRPITIRGLSTINGYSDPLIVLDNFPYEGNLADINPDDVESISILKDATAASIWGAKSANGVIVITTKKGKYNQPLSINFTTRLSIGSKPDLSVYRDLPVKDYIDVEKYLFDNNFQVSDTASINHTPFTPVYEMLLKRRAGQISAQDSAGFIRNLLSVDPAKEYLNNFYQNPVIQQYNLTLGGGTEKYSWLMSGSYNRSIGTLKRNGDEKKNLRIENRYKPFKGLELNMGLYYTQTTETSRPTPSYKSVLIGNKWVPYLRFTDGNGNPAAVDRLYRNIYTDTAGAGQLLNWKYYPLDDYKYESTSNLSQSWLWQFSANYSFLKHFSATVNYQQEQQTSERGKLSTIESFYTRDLINQFAQSGISTDGSLTFNIPVGDIYSIGHGRMLTRNARGQLNYSKTTTNLSIYALAGGELREAKVFGGDNITLYGYSEDPLHFSSINYNTPYPNYVTGYYSTIVGGPLMAVSSTNRFVSAYVNTAVTFKNRYTFNGSLRRDASNIFGLSTNDKWNPFWSTGLAWNISNEGFYGLKWLSLLKLRTTLGVGGNIDPSRTALPVSLVSTDQYTNYPVRSIKSLNNPALRWEQSKQLNVALDLEALNHRLIGSFDFYIKKSENLFGPAPLDYTAWGQTNTVIKNVASMKGRGVEINILSKNVLKPLEWTTGLLFNYNNSRVVDYFIEDARGIGFFIPSGGRSIFPVVGKPLYSFAAYRWGGLDKEGNPQGYVDGALSTDYQKISNAKMDDVSSYVFMGNADPKLFGSISNTFNYKSFYISANVSYRLNYYFRKPALQYNSLYYAGIGDREFSKRWQSPGDELTTSVPSMVYTTYPQFLNRDLFYQYSEVNVLRADNIRLEYINVGYTLETGKWKRSAFKQLTLAANVANLGLLWAKNREGIDPDYPALSSPPVQFTFSLSARF